MRIWLERKSGLPALDFARAVLDRVEGENPAFREKVTQAVQEALERKTSPLTLDELRSAILDDD